jgi:hypothetical protein
LVELQGNVVTRPFKINRTRIRSAEVRINPSGFQFLPSRKEKNEEKIPEYSTGQVPH